MQPYPPQYLLVLCAQETPDPWQSLDPFDSLDSKPFKKGNWVGTPPLTLPWPILLEYGVVGGSGLCTPIPWLLETAPACPQVGHTLCPPVWRRLQDRSARGKALPSYRTSTSGTWPPVSAWWAGVGQLAPVLGPGQGWWRREGQCSFLTLLAVPGWWGGPGLGLVLVDQVSLQMLTTPTAGGPGEKAQLLQVRQGPMCNLTLPSPT